MILRKFWAFLDWCQTLVLTNQLKNRIQRKQERIVFIDFHIECELTGNLKCQISHPIYANSWWQVKMGQREKLIFSNSIHSNLPFLRRFKNTSQKPVATMQIFVEAKRLWGVHIQIISRCIPNLDYIIQIIGTSFSIYFLMHNTICQMSLFVNTMYILIYLNI